jgi:hypothetical protein
VLDDVGFSAMGCYGGPIETTAKASSVERPFILPGLSVWVAILQPLIRAAAPKWLAREC